MSRLFTPGGDEICSLVHLEIVDVTFVADVAPHVAAHTPAGDAVLRLADGARYRVILDAWEVTQENGHDVGRVRGRIAARLSEPP
jgi:hypothetical protein